MSRYPPTNHTSRSRSRVPGPPRRIEKDSDEPRDLANAEFQKASRITCMVEPEGRIWGMHGARPAAILLLKIQSSEEAKLRYLNLKLTLGDDTFQLPESPAPEFAHGKPLFGSRSGYAAFQPEAPTPIGSVSLGVIGKNTTKPSLWYWTFAATPITDPEGRSVGAEYKWNENKRDPQKDRGVLYGGLGLRHKTNAFSVRCEVQARFRGLMYSRTKEAIVQETVIEPNESTTDLKHQMENLNVKLKSQNEEAAVGKHPLYGQVIPNKSFGVIFINPS